MSHRVYVQTELGRTGLSVVGGSSASDDPFVELEDESAEALERSGGSLVRAISPTGPNAYFNALQQEELVAQIRATAAPASRTVQRNLNDVADFIDAQTRNGALERYVSFLVG
jgi:hypothetical protein